MKLATEKQINFIESLERQTGANIFEVAREIGAYYTGDLLNLNRRAASEIIDILLEIKKLRNFAVTLGTTTEDSVEAETVEATEEKATTTEPVKKTRKTRKISEETAEKLIATLEALDKDTRKILAENTTVSEYNYLVNPQTRNTCVSKMMEKHANEILALFENC